jgi:hypothetical protein
MVHAEHFLQRLERTSGHETELALDLYYDSRLVQAILTRARLPEQAARVAISLDHAEDGPFVIVTREGEFVTCLGRGMSPGEHPIITRRELDRFAHRHRDLKERMTLAKELSKKRSGLGGLFDRIFAAGESLCREEMIALSAFKHLYIGQLLECFSEITRQLMDEIPAHMTPRALREIPGELLDAAWRALWAQAHIALLFADGAGKLRASQIAETADMSEFSPVLTHLGFMPIAVRAAWMVGRMGRALLPDYKQSFDLAIEPWEVIDRAQGLTAIGLRDSKCYGEVKKVLERRTARTHLASARGFLQAFEGRAALDERAKTIGAARAMRLTACQSATAPVRYRRTEDVPDSVAFVVASLQPGDYLRDPRSLELLVALQPWVSRAKLEDLYLPKAIIGSVARPCPRELVARMLKGIWIIENSARAKSAKLAGRNDPCPCASGRKYKRCCLNDGLATSAIPDLGRPLPPLMRAS